jgi:DNA-binding response OmpR family regulator
LTDRLVLVADDDNDIRDLITCSLGSAGFRTVTAKDGNTAARIATVAGVDAVVTDVRMPALTAADVSAGRSAGVPAYLRKPLSPREIVALLRLHLPPGESA